jgi:hypothetical protein
MTLFRTIAIFFTGVYTGQQNPTFIPTLKENVNKKLEELKKTEIYKKIQDEFFKKDNKEIKK